MRITFSGLSRRKGNPFTEQTRREQTEFLRDKRCTVQNGTNALKIFDTCRLSAEEGRKISLYTPDVPDLS